MTVDEVRVGMKGFGLSVFKGTKIERFDVEVVSVLRNFNPKRDVVLIRSTGQNLEHTGSVAGMSGSPIFLRDDTGKDRMIGAFAYGWSLAKDPIAGVQPIQYMLELASESETTKSGERASARGSYPTKTMWDASTLLAPMTSNKISLESVTTQKTKHETQNAQSLRPLSTPLCAAALPSAVAKRFAPLFARHNLLLAEGAAGGDENADAKIEPGSVIIAPLLVGDVQFHANGTVTEVLGEHVFAFGHPFNNEGEISLPFSTGSVNAIIASLESSFKIASAGANKGELDADHAAGIAGKLGKSPAMVPIEYTIIRPDGREMKFNFSAARHARLLPLLAAVAMDSALVGESQLPQYNTINYDITMTFDNGKTLNLSNADANAGSDTLLLQLITPITAAAENPFERVLPKKIEGKVTISDKATDAQILAVQIPKTKFRPGETITGFITYRPFRGEEANLPFSMPLPHDLPDGAYQLVVGDWQRYFGDETAARPFRFNAETIDEVFEVVQDVLSIRHDELFIRLLRQPDGVAIGRVAMAQLPSSRRQVLLGAGRSNVSAFVSSDVQKMPTKHLMTGSAEFTIQIENQTRTEIAKSPSTKPAN